MANNNGPRWCKPAEERVGELVELFRTNLRRIALRLGAQDRSDTLDVRHVEAGFDALSRLGLQRYVWWKRPQLKMTVASALSAIAMSAPDFLPYIGIEQAHLTPTLWVLCSISGILALWLYSWAWLQDRL